MITLREPRLITVLRYCLCSGVRGRKSHSLFPAASASQLAGPFGPALPYGCWPQFVALSLAWPWPWHWPSISDLHLGLFIFAALRWPCPRRSRPRPMYGIDVGHCRLAPDLIDTRKGGRGGYLPPSLSLSREVWQGQWLESAALLTGMMQCP